MAGSFRSVSRSSSVRANILAFESVGLLVVQFVAIERLLSPAAGVVRRQLLIAFAAVYLLRLNVMARWILARELAIEEITLVTLVWIPAMLASFTAGAALCGSDLSLIEIFLAVAAYSLGSYLNTYSELQRKRWKQRPENSGRCYTLGLFSLSRNINYLGDVILFAGWALLSSAWWNAWVPLTMASIFYFHHIPDKEAYLAKRYARDWPSYSAKTPSFIPWSNSIVGSKG